MAVIRISDDYSKVPAGRFRSDGPYSGERFRDELLIPALANGQSVTVFIEGTAGYGSSFLEEAFGGLVRAGISANDLHQRLRIETQDASFRPYIASIWRYIDDARSNARVA